MKRLKPGEHVLMDPNLCHVKPTFKGMRIMVKPVLDMVAEGAARDEIIMAGGAFEF